MTDEPAPATLSAGTPRLRGYAVGFLAVLWSLWAAAILTGEKLPVNDGLGWDGSRFARMTAEGPDKLLEKQINSYYVQRVGPSYAVRALLLTTRTPIDNETVRAGFIALNAGLLSLALVLMLDAGRRLGLGPPGWLVLFLVLFVNPANARLPIYYAPIGDSTAFFIGALIAWGYVSRRAWAAVAGFAIAIVSWPAAFALLPLLLWPRSNDQAPPEEPAARVLSPARAAVSVLAAAILGAGVIAFLWWASDMPLLPADLPGLRVSLTANALVVGFIVLAILNAFHTARPVILRRPSMFGFAIAAGLIGVSVLYVTSFESGSVAFSGQTYVREILLFARSKPLTTVAGHAAYYGFGAVAAMVLWPRVLREAVGLGPGAFIAVAGAGLMSMDAESRRLNASVPLVGLLAAVVVARFCGERGTRLVVVAVTVAVSKLWWLLTGPDLFPAIHEPGNYTNLQGPNMSPAAVTAHLLATAVIGAALLWKSRRPFGAPS